VTAFQSSAWPDRRRGSGQDRPRRGCSSTSAHCRHCCLPGKMPTECLDLWAPCAGSCHCSAGGSILTEPTAKSGMRNSDVAGPSCSDTCAAIWLMSRTPLSSASRAAIRAAQTANLGVYLSLSPPGRSGRWFPKARLHLTLSPRSGSRTCWRYRECGWRSLRRSFLSPRRHYPGKPPSDPADRIIAPTARLNGYRVITRDSKLLAYAAQGHILATAC